MSFDLAVWRSDESLSVEEAQNAYLRLCKQEWIPAGENAAVAAFYEALCERYPEIDTLPEDQLDDCPWSCAHDKSGGHVIMCMAYADRLEEVAKLIVDLAAVHGLICYDPQGPNLYLPPNLKPKRSRFRFWSQ